MPRRTAAIVLSLVQMMAATVLELWGYNPHDQVIIGLLFGLFAVLIKDEEK